MRQAVFLPNFGPFGDPESLVGVARTAEQSGWDGFFVWDHIQWSGESPAPVVDPWVSLGAIAASTSKIRLGTMITPLARRRPWKVARETLTVDRLSRGRMTLGVGLGTPVETEFETFGEETDARTRAARLDEGLAVLDGLWRGEGFSFDGEHYKIDRAQFHPRAFQEPRIPIWCGGWWPNRRPFRRAARWDGVIPELVGGATPSPEDVTEIRAYVDEHRPSGRPYDAAGSGYTGGDAAESSAPTLEQYKAAGLTWWLERIDLTRLYDLDEARERILAGPAELAARTAAP